VNAYRWGNLKNEDQPAPFMTFEPTPLADRGVAASIALFGNSIAF